MRARGHEDDNVLVLYARILHEPPLVAAHAAMNRYDRVGLPDERPDACCEIIERVPIFGEDNQFASMALSIE